MNKTISVNIGGRVFNIEENAFDKLNRYLNTIRGYFEGHESTDEIISDIELRIAELFMNLISEQKQVITVADVDEVIKIMGKPEDYVDEEDAEAHQSRSTKRKTNKRVFRDPDNKVVFGVCGGISAYLGWDPIVLRALFVLGVLVFGTGFLIYIILAIVIPKAITTADKLRMRGEPVTVDNISKKVNESFDDVKEDIKSFGANNNINKERIEGIGGTIGGFFEDLAGLIGKILRLALLIITKAIGLVFFLAGVTGIFFAVAAIFGHESFIAMIENHLDTEEQVNALISGTFSSTFQYISFAIGSVLTFVVPAIAFLILGIRLLFDYKKIPGIVGLVLVILWVVGMGLLAACGVNMFREFNVETSFTERVQIELPISDTLYLDIADAKSTLYNFNSEFNSRKYIYGDAVTFPSTNSTDIVYENETEFTVEINENDTVFELYIERSAHGSNNKDAVLNARQSESAVRVQGDSLLISPFLVLPEGTKLRGQEVRYILRIPEGKSIHFNKHSGQIIYDVPNVTNTRDHKMLNLTWVMTPEGLKCTTIIEDNSVPEAPEVREPQREREEREAEHATDEVWEDAMEEEWEEDWEDL